MRQYKWRLRDGREVTLTARYQEKVVPRILDADGWKIEAGEEIQTDAMLTAYIDGKKHDSCWDPGFWQVIKTSKPGVKQIWGIKNIGFTDDCAAEIEAFLSSVIEEGRDEKAQALRDEKAAKELKDLREHYSEVVAKAEAQHDIPDRKEAKRRMKVWNDIHNEGGEGFVPRIVCQEEYDEAKAFLSGCGCT